VPEPQNYIISQHTGHVERIDDTRDKIPPYDPRSGNHFWIMITSFKCDPKLAMEGNVFMDHETLVNITGPVCFYCELPYTETIYHRRCKGEPSS